MMDGANIDPEELAKFEALAPIWWDRRGAFKALHDINGLRVGYIHGRAPLTGKRVLDVGCGGGILSEAMATLGGAVTGIDAASAPLSVARLHVKGSGLQVDYRISTAEQFAESYPEGFDVVACLSPETPPEQGPDDPASTACLLRRARHGDRVALEQVFARQFQSLRAWASGRLPHWARGVTDTDDLIQDVLLQAFKRLADFGPRGQGALYAYLRQGVMNRLRDELRRQARRPLALPDEAPLAAMGPSPLDLAIGAESVARYERALDTLRPGEKECLVARLELGFSFEELAQWTGRPSADAARKDTERALVRLVEEMNRSLSG